jgi:hypothetical protein
MKYPSVETAKRTFYQVLVTCLLASAAIAVVAVLLGSFNEILMRSLGTIGIVALHSLISFTYISESERRDASQAGPSSGLLSTTIFSLIVGSFVVSVFTLWGLLEALTAIKFYAAFGVLVFATLHAEVLYRICRLEKQIDTVVTSNYVFMAVVVVMLIVAIFSADSTDLGEFFYRVLAACGIIDATLTITAIILHKMYLQKHPHLVLKDTQEGVTVSRTFWKSRIVTIVAIYLGFQLLSSLIFAIRGGY